MSDILEKIIQKRKEDILASGLSFGENIPSERTRKVHPFLDGKGLILEVKRASPSKGDIAPDLDPYKTASHYVQAGTRAISCLTEKNFFKGSLSDLMQVCRAVDDFEKQSGKKGPAVLRKDFLLTKEEVEISYNAGADAVLLIARILNKEVLLEMAHEVQRLGLSALVEIRSDEDLDKLSFLVQNLSDVKNFVAGVNSRNLANFKIDLLRPCMMMNKIQSIMGKDARIIFESGVTTGECARVIGSLGFTGLLLGEAAAKNPEAAKVFVNSFTNAVQTKNADFWKNHATKKIEHNAHKKPFVKICGLTRMDDVLLAEKLGADFTGFIFSHKYPRSVTHENRLEKLLEKIREVKAKKVCVVTELQSPESQKAVSLVRDGIFDVLQFHNIPYEDVGPECLELPHYFAVKSVQECEKLFLKGEFRVLLDSKDYVQAVLDGTACETKTSDFFCNENLWLAGGLNPDNVNKLTECELLDVSSGIEMEDVIGIKSEEKMNSLFENINRKSCDSEKSTYSKEGFFENFGGKYVAEVLRRPLDELELAFKEAINDKAFLDELEIIRRDYIGRETPLYFAPTATKLLGGAQIYIKLEGLANTGAHKINNAIGQCLLAKRMGKKRIIAETGAGQHGLATAAACAKLGLDCTIYMGEVDVRRQQPNVAAMELYGAKVHPVTSGSRTLKDAVNEAMRDWAANPDTTHYVLGSALGPAPFPDIVREFQSVIGREVKRQAAERGIKIGAMVACVGGGSNSIGFFEPFINESSPRLIGAEAGGIGPGIGENASRMTGNAGRDGILQGYKSRFLLDEDGQALPTRSISAGLDYCGIGPQLASLGKSGRVEFTSILDKEALEAVSFFAKNEGILFALESAHAGAAAMKLAKEIPSDQAIIINMSGRGDKDVFITSPVFRPDEWINFLHAEIERLESKKDIHEAKVM